MSGKFALIIGNTEYTDPGLAQLTAPGKDTEDFARVLRDKEICAFDDVNILLNQPEPVVRGAIDEFFDQKRPDDLLVLYFSGHGVRDELGSLYLAVRNTIRNRLRSTAIKSDYIREAMDQSRSKRQILILDCCNSGAFAQGTKSATGVSIGTASAFEGGYGRIILTASDSTQFAWEGDKVIGETDNSLFTHFLVEGLDGEADLDSDGRITVDELYDYAYEKVRLATPKQTPSKFSSKQQGEIVLRQKMRIEDIKPLPLPDELIGEIEDTRPYVREAAVQKLEKILKGKNIGLSRSATEALEKIVEDENTTRRVAQLATQAMEAYRQVEKKAEEERKAKEEAERLALLKAEEGRLAREKAEAERKAREEAERLLRAKAEQEAAEREAMHPKAKRKAAEKATREKAERETAEKAAREEAEREATENAEHEKANREAAKKATDEKAGHEAIEQFTGKPEKATSIKTVLQQQPFLRWAMIGLIGLCVIATGIWSISYLASLGTATEFLFTPIPATEASFTIEPTPTNQPVLAGTSVPFSDQKIMPDNANEVVSLARWGKGGINQVAYSPNGKIIAAASTIGIYFYDAVNLHQLRFIDTGSWIYSVAFSPDGLTLASGSYDNTVRLWRVDDGTLLNIFEGHSSYVESVAFSPNGEKLASGANDDTIRIWRVSDGTLLKTIDLDVGTTKIVFSPDGSTLASGSWDDAIRLWRVSDGVLVHTLKGHIDVVWCVVFSPDGLTLASGSRDDTTRLWSVSDGSLLRTFESHEDGGNGVGSVTFSPDGSILASGGSWVINLWEVSDGTLLNTLTGYGNYVESVAFSPDGTTLASGSFDQTIRLWRASDGVLLKTMKEHTGFVNGISFSPDGSILASGTWNNIQLWRPSDGALLKISDTGTALQVTFAPDGLTLAAGTSFCFIQLLRVSDNTLLETIEGHNLCEGHNNQVWGVAFSPDGQTLATGSLDKTIRLWRVSDGTLLNTLEGHTDGVWSVAFSPDGQTLASGSSDKTIRLWQVSDGTLLKTLKGHVDDVRSVTFSPDGKTLASGSYDKTIRLWRVNDGVLLKTLEAHNGGVLSVAFSPDGSTLASGSGDATVRLWQVINGSLLKTLEGHTLDIDSVAFSPDGKTLASGSSDGTIRLWGVIP